MTDDAPPMGARLRRKEDPEILQGKGKYVGDLRLPGMLYAEFVRCPLGHAAIRELSLQEAQSMPGVAGAFSAGDLPALGQLMPLGFEQPGLKVRVSSPLAGDEVRYAGEAVAVVVADDPYRAADAAAAVVARYEELPAVVDPVAAREPDAPQVHPDVPRNDPGGMTMRVGDIAGAFAAAEVVVQRRLRTERAAAAFMEPRGVAAMPGGPEGIALTVWASTQAPHNVRRTLAKALNLAEEQVRVITPLVGGGFGAKGRLYPEEIAVSALALHLSRPVLWQAARRADMLTTFQGRGMVMDAELAAKRDGTILGLRVRLLQDLGAYMHTAYIVPHNAAQHLLGPYRIPAVHIEITGAYTHKVPLTPLRGGGREQGIFAIERMMDHLGAEVGLNRREIRERNLLQPDDFPYNTGLESGFGGTVIYDSGNYPAHLTTAYDAIGFEAIKAAQSAERARGVYRGVAVTLFIESTGGGVETARARLEEDGSVTLVVGSPDNGQSHPTTLPQICAAELGVDVERIRLVSGDTLAMGQGTGTFGSRMAVMAGNATAEAAQALRGQILEAAAQELEAAPADLEITNGVVQVRGVPGRAVSLKAVAQRAQESGGELAAAHAYGPGGSRAYAGGAHACVVAVDVSTGRVTIERYLVVHDCGTMINPIVVEGQVHGGVVHGMGTALGEMMLYNRAGELETGSFSEYRLLRAEDVPHIEVIHQESPSPFNPEGIKGAGEGGTIGSLATINAAVEDALSPLGIELNDLPLRFDDLARRCTPLPRGAGHGIA